MLRKEAIVSARDFSATLFFAERVFFACAGAATDPVAIVHFSKLRKQCESQNGAAKITEQIWREEISLFLISPARGIRRVSVCYGGSSRALRWLRLGRAAFPLRASACK